MIGILLMGCVSEARLAPHGRAETEAAADATETLDDDGPNVPDDPGGTDDLDDVDVDDPPPSGDEAPREDLGPALLYGGAILDVAIGLDADARASLAASPYEEVEGTFAYGGRLWTVGVRFKGSSSLRPLDGKPSFRVDFNHVDPDGDFYGVKHVTLNNMVQDETMLREDAYYWLCARLGVPAPRHGWARVTVDGAAYGLYGVVEAMDDQFVDAHFAADPGGALYEGSGDDFTPDLNHFERQEPGEGDVDDFVADLSGAVGGGPVLDALRRHFDTDALFTYWALDRAGGNDDGYIYNNHNFHLYYAPAAGRWTMMPWGVDRSFEDRNAPIYGDALLYTVEGTLAAACLAEPACRAEMDAALLATVEAWEDLDLVGHVEATRDVIAEDAEADPRAEDPWQPWKMVEFAEDAPDWVRGQLGG